MHQRATCVRTATLPRAHCPRAPRTMVHAVAPVPSLPASCLDWTKQDTRRMLHAAYRVPDVEASIAFYEGAFGMKVLHSTADDDGTDAVLGFGASKFVLKLTNRQAADGAPFDIGPGFGHFGLAVSDIATAIESVKAAGGKFLISMEEDVGGDAPATIAFIEDNTGYWWELIERVHAPIVEPIAQVMLRVTDLERAIVYYRDCLGMTLIRTRDVEEHKFSLAYMGYGPEVDGFVVELMYNWGTQGHDRGHGYRHITISTTDLLKTADAIKAAGGTVTRGPELVPGTKSTRILASVDPDGWEVVLVDEGGV